MKSLILEQEHPPGSDWEPISAAVATRKQNEGCTVEKDSNGDWYLKKASCGNETETSPETEDSTPPTETEDSTPPTENSGIHIPKMPDLEGLITNAWGKIVSWFGSKVDETGNWMKDKFTKSDIEKAQEECYKVPFKDEESAKKALESGDIVDYYQLKDKDGKVVFLGKSWDCENKGGTPPCFKNLSSGKYNPENQSYIEEYFEELDDAGVYEYYCNGSVAFKPYYESDKTGGYVESDRPKVWYKWDPKTGVIDKS